MRTPKVSSGGGPERYILAVALIVPLLLGFVALAQLPGMNLGMPSTLVYADADPNGGLITKRPAASQPAPPPTLAPRPTATSVPAPAAASPTPKTGRLYTVQKGDELKHIAAEYGVSIFKIIDSNDISNPDSLRIGQELKIPDQ